MIYRLWFLLPISNKLGYFIIILYLKQALKCFLIRQREKVFSRQEVTDTVLKAQDDSAPTACKYKDQN